MEDEVVIDEVEASQEVGAQETASEVFTRYQVWAQEEEGGPAMEIFRPLYCWN